MVVPEDVFAFLEELEIPTLIDLIGFDLDHLREYFYDHLH